MTGETAGVPPWRTRRCNRRVLALSLALPPTAVLVLAIAYVLTAPRLSAGPGAIPDGAAPMIAGAGRQVLFDAPAHTRAAPDGQFAREAAGVLVPVQVHDRSVLTVSRAVDSSVRLVADPSSDRPLGDGAVVKVYRGDERHSAVLIGTRERIVGPDLRLVPSYGPAEGGLPADGLPLTRLVPPGEPVTLVVERLSLDGPAPDGAVYLDMAPPAGDPAARAGQ